MEQSNEGFAEITLDDIPITQAQTNIPVSSILSQTEGSNNPVDALNIIESENKKNEQRLMKLQEASIIANEDAKFLQKFVYDSSNPNPVYLLGIVLVSLLILYILYYIFLRSSMNGHWYTDKGDKWIINHNMLTNKLCFKSNRMYNGKHGMKIYGSVKNNYVEFGKYYGIWDGCNKLYMLDGTVMTKVIN